MKVLLDESVHVQVAKALIGHDVSTNHRPTLEQHFPLIAAMVNRATSGTYLIIEQPKSP